MAGDRQPPGVSSAAESGCGEPVSTASQPVPLGVMARLPRRTTRHKHLTICFLYFSHSSQVSEAATVIKSDTNFLAWPFGNPPEPTDAPQILVLRACHHIQCDLEGLVFHTWEVPAVATPGSLGELASVGGGASGAERGSHVSLPSLSTS